MNSGGSKISNLERCFPFCVILVNTEVAVIKKPLRVNQLEDKLSEMRAEWLNFFCALKEECCIFEEADFLKQQMACSMEYFW